MSGLMINSSYNHSHYIQQKIPRRVSEDQSHIVVASASSSSHRGHKRSSSSGTPISLADTSSQSLNKSRSSIVLNDDFNITSNIAIQSTREIEGVARPQLSRRFELPKLVVPSNRLYQNIPNNSSSNQFKAYLVLEPELQPIQPDTSNKESVKIYEEHRRLSQEFLKMKMEFTLLSSRKQDLENSDNRTNLLEEYWELKSENDSLLQLKHNLITQLDLIKQKQRQKEAAADGDWVLVDRSDTQNSNGNK
jgi:hypothetical protein